VALRIRDGASPPKGRARAKSAPLFSELLELLAGDVSLLEGETPLDPLQLPLRDFHALRGVATRLGWLAEESVDIACRNCSRTLSVSPCASLEIGPFLHGELHDPELDATLDLSRAHAIPEIPLGPPALVDRGRELTLRDVTVAQAAPLHRALRRRHLAVSERLVRAMGIESIGPERDPRRLADALARCSEEAWTAIGDLFLQAHYLPRLCAVVLCPTCGARNDVDAPYAREFEPTAPDGPGFTRPAETAESNETTFPDFDHFDERAVALFDRSAGAATAEVRLVVDGGVPACDDGGEPLLGSYVPPGGDPGAPVGSAEIAIYYRTFRAIWEEDGPYDWEGELRETIDHELEHHVGWRIGHDPMDDAEREEIARERVRVVGRTQAVQGSLTALGADVRDFLGRTWPIWLIVAIATFAMIAYGR
jgi:hypothetical protein